MSRRRHHPLMGYELPRRQSTPAAIGDDERIAALRMAKACAKHGQRPDGGRDRAVYLALWCEECARACVAALRDTKAAEHGSEHGKDKPG